MTQNHLIESIIMQAIIGTSVSALLSYYFAQYVTTIQQIIQQSPPPTTSSSQLTKSNFFKLDTVIPPLRFIDYPHFHILYSTYHKAPLAVHQYITKELADGDAPRSKYFFPDDHITQKHFQIDNTYYLETQAYARFNLNRGHMAAAGNYSGNQTEKFLTFSFANIIPQDGSNNGGIWNTFERYSRDLAFSTCESVEIISGPIYPKHSPFSQHTTSKDSKIFSSNLKVLKLDGAPIPQKLYKIIKCNSKAESYYSAFEFLNEETQDNNKGLSSFEVSLADVENQTGLKFNITGKSLKELDSASLQKTKKQLDYPFYYNLIAKSTKISEMADGQRRARSQKIDIQFNVLSQKIREMTKKQFQEISAETSTSCEKLKRMLALSKKLTFLKHLEQTSDIRDKQIQETFIQCKSKPQEYSSIAEELRADIQKLKLSFEAQKE